MGSPSQWAWRRRSRLDPGRAPGPCRHPGPPGRRSAVPHPRHRRLGRTGHQMSAADNIDIPQIRRLAQTVTTGVPALDSGPQYRNSHLQHPQEKIRILATIVHISYNKGSD